jgi:hypothetical protein
MGGLQLTGIYPLTPYLKVNLRENHYCQNIEEVSQHDW